MRCAEMTDLQFIVATNTLWLPRLEREEPSRKYEEKTHPLYGGSQCLHKGHGVTLGNFVLVPVPVHIDAKA
jgi:hypothetical protein